MPKHPPLCPKTEGNWMTFGHTGAVDVIISDDTYLDDDLPDHRQFIARFQACAWQDRAARWVKAIQRVQGGKREHFFGVTGYFQASDNAKAWRAWEKQP